MDIIEEAKVWLEADGTEDGWSYPNEIIKKLIAEVERLRVEFARHQPTVKMPELECRSTDMELYATEKNLDFGYMAKQARDWLKLHAALEEALKENAELQFAYNVLYGMAVGKDYGPNDENGENE